MTTADGDIPEDYAPHFRKSPLTDPWEPLFSRMRDGTVSLGLRVREAHCNGRGFLHGGLISALADNAMGLSVIETLRRAGVARERSGVTVSLAVDFVATAKRGQWIEFVPRVIKAGGSIAFVDCVVLADGEPIARGNATFRVYEAQAGDRA